jgi:type IV pilus assembly protein PilB
MRTKKRLGEILVELGAVDELQLQSALAYQRKWGVPLGQALVDMRFCAAHQVLEALASQTGVQAVDLDAQPLEPTLARLLPQRLAEQHRVVPLKMEGPRDTVLVVAIAAPASLHSLDAVRSVTCKLRVVPKLATDAAITRAIERLYEGQPEAPRWPEPEALALPEAEEDLRLSDDCLAEELAAGGGFDAGHALSLPELELEQETLELPLLEPLDLAELEDLAKLVGDESARAQAGEVLVYGWGAAAAVGMVKVLREAGFRASVASTEWVLSADEGAVVLAPLPSLEAMEQLPRAQLLAAGKVPEVDVNRAHDLGARGFLAAPVDPDLMLRAVRRLLRAAGEAPRSRGSRRLGQATLSEETPPRRAATGS